MEHYAIEYDCSIHEDNTMVVFYAVHLPNTKEFKCLLKAAFVKADRIEYCFGGLTKKKKARKARVTATSAPVIDGGTILLSGILNKNVPLDLLRQMLGITIPS